MNVEIKLTQTTKMNSVLRAEAERHYSKPGGFVGRSICYAISVGGVHYGHIVGGSATKHLPGRDEFLGFKAKDFLNNIVNNIFYHVEPQNGKYPTRNFTSKVLREFERIVVADWELKYGDKVFAFESLVELPRTGELYRRQGWTEVGTTKGFTCKRIGGKPSTDSWGGCRTWDYTNLRPKRVFCKLVRLPPFLS